MSEATGVAVLTGEQYLESLRDGREVWIDGERVPDVTDTPRVPQRDAVDRAPLRRDARRRAARDAARRGPPRHRHPPVLHAELQLAGPACLARGDRGVVARLLWLHGPHAGLQGRRSWRRSAPTRTGTSRSATAVARWYRRYAEQVLFLNHVLINPPIDRNKAVHEVEDVFVHVVEERDDGMVVRGAKMLATGSALTHATFVAQNSAVELQEGKAEDYALVLHRADGHARREADLAARPTRPARARRSMLRCRAASTRTTP